MKKHNKHTPGDWRYKECRSEASWHAVYGPPHPQDGGDYAPIARFTKKEDAILATASPTMLRALEAVKARINGEFDHPSLKKFGPLSPNTTTDCLYIVEAALAKATGAA